MRTWLADLDQLLRGRSTTPELLGEAGLPLRVGRFVVIAILLGAIYGFFMGWYSLMGRGPEMYQAILASMVKLPALFLVTLVVTFPSLYVFNALLGSQLTFVQTLRLLIGAIVVNLAVAASLGPILGFFTLSTTSYPFMVVLNVALLGLAGVVALGFLMASLRRVAVARLLPLEPPRAASMPDGGQPIDRPALPPDAPRESRQIFRLWVLIYGLVGAQTGWLLRPFIGHPDLPFTWFRQREGNFFEALWQSLQALTH